MSHSAAARSARIGGCGLSLLAAIAMTPWLEADAATTQRVALLVTNAQARHVSFVDPQTGAVQQVEVGAAPFGLAVAPGSHAYIATAEGVAVIDTRARRRLALIPYQSEAGSPQFGEYRHGGKGIAVSPDGRRVYVAVHASGQSAQLEVIDTARRAVTGKIAVGTRPFDVIVSSDGRRVYTIDHDSFTVTVVELPGGATRTLTVAPLGRGAFDKPHYAALRPDGRLLLPFQGRVLVVVDPVRGEITTTPLTASTHQHGVALTPDGRRLLIVGTGPAGGVAGGPSLTIVDMVTRAETILPMSRAHERVAVSPDGRQAYLTGGFLLGGWDGLTIVDLERRSARELPVPDRPLDIAVLR